MPDLSPKQQRFLGEYLVDFNAAQAAIRAGYSKKGAREAGYRLLTYGHIAKAVERHVQATAEKLTITREAVLKGLLEAAAMAKVEGSTVGMVTAWREIAKLLGLYPSGRLQIESKVTMYQEPTVKTVERMTDAELLEIINGKETVDLKIVGSTPRKRMSTVS
jgi:phage terminase small subunit